MPRQHNVLGCGATCRPSGTTFRVWAPGKRRLDVCVGNRAGTRTYEMAAVGDGTFESEVAAKAGDVYGYLVDGHGPYPDPVSRFQPFGVHGPSEIIDPSAYTWSDHARPEVDPSQIVLYELHIGTFTAEGTFAAAAERLPYLSDLGVTTLELMPVGDFAGERNWGYDVAALFAPARCYGRPDDLRQLVDAAHHHGLTVILDVVYNHFGPDGAYVAAFSPFYFSSTHRTPWGPALNLDGKQSAAVRALLIQNALYWLQEFHFDGLRLDATHALIDGGPRHFLAELSERVRAAVQPRTVLLIAEDARNDARVIRAPGAQGYGFDAVWADDLHHHLRRHVTGDDEGYFADYSGSTQDIASTIQRGWFYCGQRLPTSGRPRGTATDGLLPEQFIVCLQNHDQVGNRAFGDRLHHRVTPAVYRALSVLLLGLPQTPLLFMGQEWATASPFLFFTDHRARLGARVRRGRRREFAAFRAFADPAARAAIPDPQARATFRRSQLEWSELAAPGHARIHDLYRSCLRLRAAHPFRARDGAAYACSAMGPGILALARWTAASTVLTVVSLDGATAQIDMEAFCRQHLPARQAWSMALHTEAPVFAEDAQPATIDLRRPFPVVSFARPGAIVLVGMPA